VPKSSGIQIAQINASGGNQGLTGGSGTGALEMLQRLSDSILYGSGQKAALTPQTAHFPENSVDGDVVDPEKNAKNGQN